jgi:Flp pilus assembly protein CpaB
VLFSNARLSSSTAIPQDIIAEVLVAVVIVSVGLVLGAEKLKPISWRDWAGEIEREGGARNPYLSLEERHGFWDIRVRHDSSFSPVATVSSLVAPRLPGRAIAPDANITQYSMKSDANTILLNRLSARNLRIGFGKRIW